MNNWRITEFEEVTSTNTIAKERLLYGFVRHGDVIQARHQTAGRGRLPGREWKDEPGQSLLMSIVLERVPVRSECVQYLAALAVLSVIRELLVRNAGDASSVFLKWPNDILIAGKKACGVLTEAIWQGNTMRAAIVGIGVNVLQRAFFGPLQHTGISLHLAGIEITVNELRETILLRLESDLLRYDELGTLEAQGDLIATLRNELAWMIGTPPLFVTVDGRPVLQEMAFEHIGEDGAMTLRHPDGKVVTLHSGSIEWEVPVKGIPVTNRMN